MRRNLPNIYEEFLPNISKKDVQIGLIFERMEHPFEILIGDSRYPLTFRNMYKEEGSDYWYSDVILESDSINEIVAVYYKKNNELIHFLDYRVIGE